MSKSNKLELTEDTQAPAATMTEETPAKKKVDPTDEAFFAASYRSSDEEAAPAKLVWKKSATPEHWHTLFIREDQVSTQRHILAKNHCVQVHKDKEILGTPFTDLFEDCVFDDDGFVTDGHIVHRGTGQLRREVFMFMQPIGAYRASLQLIGEESERYLNPERGKLSSVVGDMQEAARRQGARPGMVTVRTAELGTEDRPVGGYESLR